MTNALRILLTLLTILSGTTICNASTQEAVRGVVFGKTFALERETSFSTDFVAPIRGADDVPFTFRGDTRSPSEIFENGFQPRGTSDDLFLHALN